MNRDETLDPATLSEIHQTLHAYVHHLDDAEWDRFEDLFTADAVFDMSSFGGGRHEGRPSIGALFRGFDDHSPAHLMTNVFVEMIEGEVRARSKWCIARHGVLAGGVYRDRLARSDDRWRIRERICTFDWSVPDVSPTFLERQDTSM
jgi:3-phenylpropionate/cinnamic acid dioxygenase small subunit